MRIVRVEFIHPVTGPGFNGLCAVTRGHEQHNFTAQRVDAIEEFAHGVRLCCGTDRFTVPWANVKFTQEEPTPALSPWVPTGNASGFMGMTDRFAGATGTSGAVAPSNQAPPPPVPTVTLEALLKGVHHKQRKQLIAKTPEATAAELANLGISIDAITSLQLPTLAVVMNPDPELSVQLGAVLEKAFDAVRGAQS